MGSENIIVNIPKTMEKFFGCSGKMLKPSPSTVASFIRKIPKGKVATLNVLCEMLAKKFKTEVTCPTTTEKSLCLAATESITNKTLLPYWRVLKKNGDLIRKLPSAGEYQAVLLTKEGHKIVASGKSKALKGFERVLHRF